jgi:integrase
MKHPEDPLSVASATLVYTGLRSDEVMGAQVRDLDAEGTVFGVGESKTEAGRRGVEVADILRPYLQALAKDRQGQEYLFEFTPQRVRPCKNERKRRTDALLRRTRSICKAAGLPVVCSQSMRGLHSDLAAGFGVTGHAVAKALGHTSFSITKRHYVDRSIVENANLKKTLEVLCRDVAGNCPPKTSYRSAQEPSTKDMQKTPELSGVRLCEEGDSNPHGS